MSSILDLLDDSARGNTTVRFLPEEPESRPCAELWRASAGAGETLRERVGAGGAVAAVLSSSSACLTATAGAWRAGLTLASVPGPARGVPIPEYAKQVETMCALVGAELLLVDPSYLPLIPELSVRVAAFDDVVTGGEGNKQGRGDGTFVQFTSGSTMYPKGVEISMEAIAANVEAMIAALELDEGDVACSWLPLSHDMGLIGMCLAPWAGGASSLVRRAELILIRPESFLSTPECWLTSCAEFGASVTAAPNFGFGLASRAVARYGAEVDLRRLRICVTGAEPVNDDTLRQFSDNMKPFGFAEKAMCPAYGLAEATLAVTMVRPDEHWQTRDVDGEALARRQWLEVGPDEASTRRLVSAGSPIPGFEVRCVGDGAAVGEIELRGPSLLTRYVGGAVPTSTDGWLRTNDLGFLDEEGDLYVVGRADDVLVIGGRKLFAIDLESVAGRHQSVRPGNCGVISDGDGRYTVIAEGRSQPSGQSLEEACREIRSELTRRFGVSPSSVVFVAAGTFPKTPSGKLQHHRLARLRDDDGLDAVARVDFARMGESTPSYRTLV